MAPNWVRVSDFTYIKVNRKWYYLCIIIDLFSRKIIGWHIAEYHIVDLNMATFHNASKSSTAQFGLIFHSGQGSKYTALAIGKILDFCHVVQSFSKRGRSTYHSFEELRLDVFEYIENPHNNRSTHGAIGYKIPNNTGSPGIITGLRNYIVTNSV